MSAQKKQSNINLVIKEDLGDSYSAQILSWVLTYGRYIILITQIIVLSVFFLRFKIDRDYTDLKESVAQKQALVESIIDLETEVRHIQGKLLNIRKVTTNQDAILKILRFLEDETPSDIIYISLSITTNKIQFHASASSLNSFSYLLKQLQKDNKFSEVSLEDISRKPDGRIEFQINGSININNF